MSFIGKLQPGNDGEYYLRPAEAERIDGILQGNNAGTNVPIEIRSVAVGFVNNGFQVTANAPATVQAGDLMLAVVSSDSRYVLTVIPAGWQRAVYQPNKTDFGKSTVDVYAKIATGSEPSSYVWEQSGFGQWSVTNIAITGAARHIEAATTYIDDSTNTILGPNLPAVQTGNLVLNITSYDHSSGITSRIFRETVAHTLIGTTGRNGCLITAEKKTAPGAHTTGTLSMGNFGHHASVVLQLRPQQSQTDGYLRDEFPFLQGAAVETPAPVPTYDGILSAVLIGVNDEGWRDATVGALYGSQGGSYSGPTTVRGETVNGIFWDSPDNYVVLQGSGKGGWFSGESIWVDGVQYPFLGSFDFGAFTFGRFGASQLIFAGNDYEINWTAPGAGPITGTASGTLPLTGDATGTVSGGAVTGTAAGDLPLSGDATGTVIITGAANGTLPLGGAGAGAVTVDADAAGTLPLGGSATGQVIVTGTASGDLPLTGTATGTVATPGAITGSASGDLPLTGTATGAVSVTGAASGLLPLGGAGAGGVVVDGDAAGTLPLTGAATGAVRVTGAAAGLLPLTGTATGTVRVTGTASGLLPLGGAGAGLVTVDGDAAGTLPLTGAATGKVTIRGNAAGILPLTGTSTGTVADSGPQDIMIRVAVTWPLHQVAVTWPQVRAVLAAWPTHAQGVIYPQRAISVMWPQHKVAENWSPVWAYTHEWKAP